MGNTGSCVDCGRKTNHDNCIKETTTHESSREVKTVPQREDIAEDTKLKWERYKSS